jgi:hypothetical protein
MMTGTRTFNGPVPVGPSNPDFIIFKQHAWKNEVHMKILISSYCLRQESCKRLTGKCSMHTGEQCRLGVWKRPNWWYNSLKGPLVKRPRKMWQCQLPLKFWRARYGPKIWKLPPWKKKKKKTASGSSKGSCKPSCRTDAYKIPGPRVPHP